MRDLLVALDEALEAGRPCVYCSVVETRGSTPQKAGAAMLVFADGSQAGTLGGGCVEAEVKRQALRTLAGDTPSAPSLLSFCLDDNYGWDDGLICGGRMNILAAPLGAATAAYFHRFRGLVEAGQGCTEAAIIQDRPGWPALGSRYLFDGAGRLMDQLAATGPPPDVAQRLVPLSSRPRAYHQPGVAYLPVLPRITLLIVGGGHVGHAVARLAADVDFEIEVLDDRAAYSNQERFPGAHCIVGDIGQTLAGMSGELTPGTYALIVTRGHAHDEEALFHLATTPPATSASSAASVRSNSSFRTCWRGVPRALRVHAPLGLDIGSQTVPEIAVSIVAELIAVRNRGATIHAAREWVEL
ncbi:MAG: XdhC family protein [Gemmataceae bacterium]